jgi:hypothetical protein
MVGEWKEGEKHKRTDMNETQQQQQQQQQQEFKCWLSVRD